LRVRKHELLLPAGPETIEIGSYAGKLFALYTLVQVLTGSTISRARYRASFTELKESNMQKKLTTILLAMLLGLGTLSLAACDNDGPAENAGENIDEATDDAQDSMEDAGDSMKDNMDEAGDNIEDATDGN